MYLKNSNKKMRQGRQGLGCILRNGMRRWQRRSCLSKINRGGPLRYCRCGLAKIVWMQHNICLSGGFQTTQPLLIFVPLKISTLHQGYMQILSILLNGLNLRHNLQQQSILPLQKYPLQHLLMAINDFYKTSSL